MKNTIVKITHETIKNTFDRIRKEELLYEHMHFDSRDGDITLRMPYSHGAWIDMDIDGWLKAHNYLPVTIYDIDGKPVDIG